MLLTPENTSPGAEVISAKPYAGILRNERGFVLALSMFMLAICMILGIAAMNTSVDETDISANEVIVKRVFTLAESGLPLSVIPILTTGGVGSWTNGAFLSDTDSLQTAGSGTIQIVDGNFLFEGREEDSLYDTGWNNADKYLAAPDSAHKTVYKPIDDPFQKKKPDGTLYDTSIGNIPDIRIRNERLVIDVDVDKVAVKYLAGGVAEFGSGADGSGGSSYKIIYLMDCKATLAGRDITNISSPASEILLGYRFVPDAGI